MKTRNMQKSMKCSALGLGAAAMMGVVGVVQNVCADEFITPVAATAQSYYPFDGRTPSNAINGSGMTPNAPVRRTSTAGIAGSTMWMSDGTNQWITFDLGSVRTITGFHLWNYNEVWSGNSFTMRGIRTAGVYMGNSLLADGSPYTSAGVAWGTLVTNMVFAQADGSTDYTGSDYFFAAPVTCRYIQLYVTDHFASDRFGTYTGISEIGFFVMRDGVSPTAVTAQSYYSNGDDDRAPVHAIDGSGMTPMGTVVSTATGGNYAPRAMWLSNRTRQTWITFDLGAVQTITGFHLWNYNEAGVYPQRGIKTAGLYVGDSLLANGSAYELAGTNWGTWIQDFTFDQADGSYTCAGNDYAFAGPVTGRYIQLKVTDNFSASDPYTGISEILFYAAVPTVDVTRLESGAKVIADSVTNNVRVIDGTGTMPAPLALGAGTTSVNTLSVAATGGEVMIDPEGKTLAVRSVLLQPGASMLTIGTGSNNGTLTSAGIAGMFVQFDNLSTNPVKVNSVIANGAAATSLTKFGSGTLILAGSNTYSGGTTISEGALQMYQPTGFLPGNTAVTLSASDAVLDLSGSTQMIGSLAGVAGSSVRNLGSLTVGSDETSTVFAGAISGSGSLTKTGGGALTLSGVNTYTGATTVSAGTLELTFNGGGNAGVGTLAVGSSITVNSGGTLLGSEFNALGYADTHAGDLLTINQGGTLLVGTETELSMPYALNVVGGTIASVDGGDPTYGTIFYGSTSGTFTSAIDGTAATISAQNFNLQGAEFNVVDGPGAVDLNVTGNLIGGGGLTKKGGGTMTLNGANTYTGSTTVSNGTLVVQQKCLATNADVIIASGAMLNLGFEGTNTVRRFYVNGELQERNKVYSSVNRPLALAGTGLLKVSEGSAPRGTLISIF
jgi:autotransporter-associated beta strand protein